VKEMINISLGVSRYIHIGEVFQRVEIIWFAVAVGAVVMAAANMIWAFSLGMSQVLGLSTYKPIVIPAIVISYVIAMTSFETNFDFSNFIFYTYPLLAVFVQTGLEMLLFFSALIFKKKG
jgi:hypothetical protein